MIKRCTKVIVDGIVEKAKLKDNRISGGRD